MSCSNFDELIEHLGHKIVCTAYGKGGRPPWVNASVECETCNVVIISYDKDEDDDE